MNLSPTLRDILWWAAQALDLAPPLLGLGPARPRGGSGAGGAAGLGRTGSLSHQFRQPLAGILAVALLGAVAPGADSDDPSSVMLAAASRNSRSRTGSGREGDWRTLKRSCTAVATLLTFWPPGPEARTNSSSSSLSSMVMSGVTCMIGSLGLERWPPLASG